MRSCSRQTIDNLINNFMADLIYVGVVVLFFAVSALYVRLCERM
jgi:hypothetical protein